MNEDLFRLQDSLPPDYRQPSIETIPPVVLHSYARLQNESPDNHIAGGFAAGGAFANELNIVVSDSGDPRQTLLHEYTHTLQPFGMQFGQTRILMEGITTLLEYRAAATDVHSEFIKYLQQIEGKSDHPLSTVMHEGIISNMLDAKVLFESLYKVNSEDKDYEYAYKVNEYYFIGSFLDWYLTHVGTPWDLMEEQGISSDYLRKQQLEYYLPDEMRGEVPPSQEFAFYGSLFCRMAVPEGDPALQELRDDLQGLRLDDLDQREQGRQRIHSFINQAQDRFTELQLSYNSFLTDIAQQEQIAP